MNAGLRVIIAAGVIGGLLGGVALDRLVLHRADRGAQAFDLEHARKHLEPGYVCPMHPEIRSDKPGTCPICGMKLVEAKLDMVDAAADESEVRISPDVVNNLGVRTVPVVRKTIVRRVETPGFIQQIRKGEQSQIKAPFKGTVKKILFEPDHWYEPGTALIELESDELLQAEQRHLELLAATPAGSTEAGSATASTSPADTAAGRSDVVDTAPGTTEPAEDATNEEQGTGVLNAEQRQRLQAMGLNDDAIDEMEKAMSAEMKASMSGKEEDKAAVAAAAERFGKLVGSRAADSNNIVDHDVTDENSGGTEPGADAMTGVAKVAGNLVKPAAAPAPVVTLDDSRRNLYRLGLRPEDIHALEQDGTPSPVLVVYANKPGKIMDQKIKEGDVVEPGEFLFRIGGQVRVTVLANAFQRDAAWITTGMRADITIPHVSGDVWPGIVNEGSISINPNSQNIGIKLGFSVPFDKVRQNLYVVGTVYGKASENVLSVPVDAVIRTESQERVILSLGDGRYRPVKVSTGVEGNGDIEITAGLNEGDEVVARGQFLIDSESSLQSDFRRLGGDQPR